MKINSTTLINIEQKTEAMETLKYKIIKSKKQYESYCQSLELLLEDSSKNKQVADEIELITYLVKKWDDEHNSFEELDPIELIKYLMEENSLKAKDLVDVLAVSKGLVSDILNYKKGLSKDVIRALSDYFKISQEAFNKPYKLVMAFNSQLRNASVMNTPKHLSAH